MGLINTNEPDTLEAKQAKTKAELSALTTGAFRQLKWIYDRGHGLVNSNPYGLTKEEVLVGLGEADATQLATLAAALKTAVNTAVAGTIPDDPDPTPQPEQATK